MKKNIILSIINQKGGVGKTTVAFNLAKGLANLSYKVLAIDNDPQANLTSCFFENPTEITSNILDVYENPNKIFAPHEISDNLDIIGANIHLAKIADSDFEIIFHLKENLSQLKESYDFIIIDCLPSFGYLNMAAMNASDYLIIPVTASPFSISGMADLLDNIKKMQIRLNQSLKIAGILINLVEGRSTVIGRELEALLREDYGDFLFSGVINKSIKIEESPSFQQSIMEYAPGSKQAEQYQYFINELLKRIANE